eukprot:730755_1
MHCHFVPHEDHGMMARYNLESIDTFENKYEPIYSTVQSQGKFSSAPGVGREYCLPSGTDSRIGLTFIDSIDVETRIGIFTKIFSFDNKCYLGMLAYMSFRPGG